MNYKIVYSKLFFFSVFPMAQLLFILSKVTQFMNEMPFQKASSKRLVQRFIFNRLALLNESRYSRMDQVKFVEDSL